jgi:hypothetical protein
VPGSDTARTPSATGWPEQMITQAEAFGLAASWPVGAGLADDASIHLYCGKCEQSTGQLRRGYVTYNGSLDEMLSMVLRHMVMAHDVPLAGLRMQDNGPSDGSTHG